MARTPARAPAKALAVAPPLPAALAEELVAFIKEAKGIKDEPHAHKHKPKGKIRMTKPEVKAKIRELKFLHGRALEDSDREKALLLRRQISRLKKISRRVAEA